MTEYRFGLRWALIGPQNAEGRRTRRYEIPFPLIDTTTPYHVARSPFLHQYTFARARLTQLQTFAQIS